MNTANTNRIHKIVSIMLVFCLCASYIPVKAANMTISQEGIDFIKSKEGFYKDMYTYAGSWLIGYGTLCEEGEYPDGITEEKAEELLREELARQGNEVNTFITKNGITLQQYQYDALVSFTYNLGTNWLKGNSKLVKILKGEQATRDEVVDAFGIWCHAGGKVQDGLAKRRIQEALMFLDGKYNVKNDSEYAYIGFDAGEGETARDVLFYKVGNVYGSLPKATRLGYTFEGWQTAKGTQILISHNVQNSRTLYAKWSKNKYGKSFADVTGDKWFYHYIMELSEENVITGYPNGNYGPYDTTTTGAAVTLLMRAVGAPEQPAADNHWAGGFINYAHEKGFLDKDRLGNYDGNISRVKIAEIAAKSLGLAKSKSKSPYIDVDNGYVTALYEAGIMEGSITDKGREFAPDTDITRGEVSAIIWRIEKLIEEENPEKIVYNDYILDVLKDVPKNSLNVNNFYTEDGFKRYEDDKRTGILGIDVSEFQGDINWESVRNDGIEYAIIRVGGRGYGTGALYDDKLFYKNIQGSINAGLDTGVYFFSQAITVAEAEEEAKYVLEKIKNYNITGPVVFDWEVIGTTSARTYGLSTKTLCAAANRFCEIIADAGYSPMIYFNTYAGYIKYDLSKIVQYPFWFAQYDVSAPTFYYDFDMWQYTDKGKVDGIKENVDVNLYFKEK
ncbi:MAG: S-layer homology domain-containing protein [Clostridia bacterium]|nr:S-layer homology domain-containing protein [Clostridia bacterium]